jgi:maltooligosyltrehalose synthase
LGLKLLKGQTAPLVPHQRWRDTNIRLPQVLAKQPLYNVVTGETVTGSALNLGQVLREYPVGLLSTQATGSPGNGQRIKR